MSIKDWNGKTVIVTGAGTGVGKAICHELAARGAIVYVTARSMDKCQPVVDQITTNGFTAYAEQLEVGNWEEYKHVIDLVIERHGHLDVLINNAAIVYVGEFYDMEEGFMEKMVHVNLSSVMAGTLHAYKQMIEQGSGTIVNVSSMAGFVPTAMMVGYSATKHALLGLTRSLASEANDLGVEVRAMCLGLVDSEMLNKAEAKIGDGNVLYEIVPIKPMATTKAAKILVNGLGKKRMIIFVPGYANIYYRLQGIIPSLIFKGAVRTMRKYREVMAEKTKQI